MSENARDLVLTVNNKFAPSWDSSHALSEFWLFAESFDGWSCTWVRRYDDSVAHDLAKLGHALGSLELCSFEASSFLHFPCL